MWWESLSSLQQVSFVIATTATSIMILMIILMLIGMDSAEGFHGDVGFDFDGSLDGMDGIDSIDGVHDMDVFNSDSFFSIGGLRIVTIRTVLAFFSIGFWMMFALDGSVASWLVIVLGLVSGIAAAVGMALAMKSIYRLESSGNLDYHSAIGKSAIVYIRIPKNMSGHGKVFLNHQGRLNEVDAMTKEPEDITAKNEVVIVGLQDDSTLLVKRSVEEEIK